MIKRIFTAYKALIRIELLFGAGFFSGCAYIGFLVGTGAIR
jgi:hypothetical protein